MSAPSWGSTLPVYSAGRNRSFAPGDACRRGYAFGIDEPVRETRARRKKLRAVTGTAIRRRISRQYTVGRMKRHKAEGERHS